MIVSITEGQRKQFDHETQEATIRLSLWVPVKTLATGTNTRSLDRLYKKQATMDTYMYKPAAVS